MPKPMKSRLQAWMPLFLCCACSPGAPVENAGMEKTDTEKTGRENAGQPAGGSEFRWGVNGHPIRAPYGALSMAGQLDLLKDLGMSSYRVDVYDLDQMDTLARLVDDARPRGIEILPMLEPKLGRDEKSSYDIGYGFGKAFAARLGADIKVWELGNEWENWIGVKGDGSDPSQYDTRRYNRVRGMVRGLLDGIHAADPDAKGVVSNAGWCHYGFQQRLIDDGVKFDITGVHWYSDQGSLLKAGCGGRNILAILAQWGKPIWLTEFNTRTEAEQAAWLTSTMSELKSVSETYKLDRVHVYQLLDEPHLTDHEASYGLARADGARKPAYEAVKNFIANQSVR